MRLQNKLAGALLLVFSGLGANAQASTNFIQNGGFESTTTGLGKINVKTEITDWTVTTNAFVGDAAKNAIWGPNNGDANGLTASPDGGNFLAFGNAFRNGNVSQTVTGLTVGKTYNLSYYWGAGQDCCVKGASYDGVNAYFEDSTTHVSQFAGTPVVYIPSHGFAGWYTASNNFVATNSSMILTFFANGGPRGTPPQALLDGVSLTAAAVPEPAVWMTMLLGFAAIGGMARLRRGNMQLSTASL